MNVIRTSVNIPLCTSIEDIQAASHEDSVDHSMRQYWTIINKLVKTDGITMKLQKQILQQLHNNHMEIEKMRLLASEAVYWLNMNSDVENSVK